jgi:16S rRNA (guanine527-N7)-methyltransferase
MDIIEQQFTTMLSERNLIVNEEQLKQFDCYYRLLVEWNEKMNLTGITDREQVYIKHFYDSISLSFCMPMDSILTLVDVGSGAGFPSIPLKIMHPHLHVTIVDSLNKRIQFLQHLGQALHLTDMNYVHSRAEDAARLPKYRDQFDLATARAVARLHILNELCLPFVRSGGHFAAMKGADASDELHEAKISMSILRAKLVSEHTFKLPIEDASRHIIVVQKLAPTPSKYPRKAGIPAKQPLI